MSIQSIIDANINRVTEGCRVIEDYVRFELSDEPLTHSLSNLRKAINKTNTQYESNLQSRDITKDARANERCISSAASESRKWLCSISS